MGNDTHLSVSLWRFRNNTYIKGLAQYLAHSRCLVNTSPSVLPYQLPSWSPSLFLYPIINPHNSSFNFESGLPSLTNVKLKAYLHWDLSLLKGKPEDIQNPKEQWNGARWGWRLVRWTCLWRGHPQSHMARHSHSQRPAFQALWSYSELATSNPMPRVWLLALDYARGWYGPGLACTLPEPELSRLKAQTWHFCSHYCPPPGLLCFWCSTGPTMGEGTLRNACTEA